MRESQFTSKLLHSLNATGGYEIKLTKTGSLPFSRLEEHQGRALRITREGTLRYKLPDVGYQSPYDVMILHKEPAYVVVIFYQRGCNWYYLIPIEKWDEEEKGSIRRSLTEERAAMIGRKVII